MMHVRLFDDKQNIWILSLIFHNINFTINIGGMTTITSDKGTVLAFSNARTVPLFVPTTKFNGSGSVLFRIVVQAS